MKRKGDTIPTTLKKLARSGMTDLNHTDLRMF